MGKNGDIWDHEGFAFAVFRFDSVEKANDTIMRVFSTLNALLLEANSDRVEFDQRKKG